MVKIQVTSFSKIGDRVYLDPYTQEVESTFRSHTKTGIRSYSKCMGSLLALFGKAVKVVDASGRMTYINRNSMRRWLWVLQCKNSTAESEVPLPKALRPLCLEVQKFIFNGFGEKK